MPFLFLVWLLWLGFPVLCWTGVVSADTLILFLILRGKASSFFPLSMTLAVGILYMAYIMLRYVPYIPSFRIFSMKYCCILSNAFLNLLRWFLPVILLMWYITLLLLLRTREHSSLSLLKGFLLYGYVAEVLKPWCLQNHWGSCWHRNQASWVRPGPGPLHFDHIPQVIVIRTGGKNDSPVACSHMGTWYVFTHSRWWETSLFPMS